MNEAAPASSAPAVPLDANASRPAPRRPRGRPTRTPRRRAVRGRRPAGAGPPSAPDTLDAARASIARGGGRGPRRDRLHQRRHGGRGVGGGRRDARPTRDGHSGHQCALEHPAVARTAAMVATGAPRYTWAQVPAVPAQAEMDHRLPCEAACRSPGVSSPQPPSPRARHPSGLHDRRQQRDWRAATRSAELAAWCRDPPYPVPHRRGAGRRPQKRRLSAPGRWIWPRGRATRWGPWAPSAACTSAAAWSVQPPWLPWNPHGSPRPGPRGPRNFGRSSGGSSGGPATTLSRSRSQAPGASRSFRAGVDGPSARLSKPSAQRRRRVGHTSCLTIRRLSRPTA